MPANPPKQAPQSATTKAQADPYHGHERMARLSGRFISYLFACPEESEPVPGQTGPPQLDHFIAHALHRTHLPESVNYAALFLLQRLKARFPAAKSSSGHRLFISAFMAASKIICDDTYSNKSWCIVAKDMFALRQINQMEREMYSYLEWQLNVEPSVLDDFTRRVAHDFAGPGPYPALSLSSAAGEQPATNTSHSFGQSGSGRIYAPASPADCPVRNDVAVPSYPPTPGASRSASASPASTAAPRTPTDAVPVAPYRAAEEQGEHADAILGEPGSKKRVHSPTMRSKLQVGRDFHAEATRTIW